MVQKVTMCSEKNNWIDFDEGLAKTLEAELSEKYGLMVSSKELSHLLGYPSQAAFRQAVSRGTIPIPLFQLPNRKTRFALVKDIAWLLATQRNAEIKK